jgi:hypothetical protein
MFISDPISQSARNATVQRFAAESVIGGSNSPTNPLIRYAAVVAAGVGLSGLLSPTNAMAQQDRISAATNGPVIAATSDENSNPGQITAPGQNADLTSHRPWLVPVAHGRSRKAVIPQDESLQSWQRAQQRMNGIDQNLIICRCWK